MATGETWCKKVFEKEGCPRGMLGNVVVCGIVVALCLVLLCLVAWRAFDGLNGVAGYATEQTVAGEVAQITADVEDASDEDLLSLPRSMRLEVPSRLQYPELPTGCESVALTDALLFFGFELETSEIADEWLPTSDVDFVNAFLGDPRSVDGHACMAPGIVTAARSYLEAHGSNLEVEDATGMTFEELLATVSEGRPVIAWCTIDLAEAGDAYDVAWQDGHEYRLYPNSHCVVVSGYDKDECVVYVSDPLAGTTSYDMTAFAMRYYELGSQAIVIS